MSLGNVPEDRLVSELKDWKGKSSVANFRYSNFHRKFRFLLNCHGGLLIKKSWGYSFWYAGIKKCMHQARDIWEEKTAVTGASARTSL